jgi:carbon monoxide dehydrogenase subunit G
MPTSSVDVDRQPDEVFAFVTDPTHFAEWQNGVARAHMETDGSPAVGDKCFMTRRVGFAQRVVTSEVTHIDPQRRWGVRGIDGPIRAIVDVTVESLDGGSRSRVSIDVDFEGHGIGKLIVPLVVRPQAAKEMPGNLQRLKQRLEGSHVRDGQSASDS